MELPEGELEKFEHVREWVVGRIRDFRIARGFTQKQLGDAMGGVHSSRICDFEANRSDYKASTVYRAAIALGVSMQQVFRGCPGWKARREDEMIVAPLKLLRERMIQEGWKDSKVDEFLSKFALELEAGEGQ